MKKFIAGLSALVLAGAGVIGLSTSAAADDSVIVVSEKSEAPQGTVWTPGTPDPLTCLVIDLGVHTEPGQTHEAVTEDQSRYSKVVKGSEAVLEYKFQRTVADYKTQYHFAKFTREKSKTPDVKGFWQEFSPTKPKTFQGPPAYPTDPRGKWSAPKYSGGPQQDASGVFQNAGGNGSWFYRQQAVEGTWSDWSEWTKWSPEQHTSWQDSADPLGTPQPHASTPTFYREWQARFDGQTREVPNGSHEETSDWVTEKPDGEGWVKIDERTAVEAVPDTTVYYVTGGTTSDDLTDANWTTDTPGEPWVLVDERTVTIKEAYTDPDVVTHYSHTYKSPDCTPPPLNTCVPGEDVHSTNLNEKWSNIDTRSAGHYEYVENGLRVWTDDNSSQAKVSRGIAHAFPLKNTGVLDLDWTGSTPPPGINLFVNFGADGNGTLVYESVYGQDLWLTNGSSAAVKANAPVNGGGNGSQWHGTINQWLEKYPDAQVTGIAFSLGSGVLGDGVINSITANCTVFTFDYEKADEPVTVVWDLEPVAPTCKDDGKLPDLPEQAGVTFAWDREFDGPGEYTVTATAEEGYVIVGDDSKTITVEGKTGYQSEDPEASCYVEVPENESSEEGAPVITCDNEVGDVVEYEVTITETTYELDTETGEVNKASSIRIETREHTVTQADIDALDCPTPTPTPTPTPDPTPTVDPTPSPDPTESPVPSGERNLPATGGDAAAVVPIAIAAGVTIFAGAILLALIARRRRALIDQA